MAPIPNSEPTLESFRSAVASGESAPAGVAISAVSASLALGLLAKVVTIASRRKDFAGDLSKAANLADAAQSQSKRMLQYADEDVATFSAYMASVRLPQTTARERETRRRALDLAIRKAIETPMEAARAAASGIELCAEAAELVHTLVAADLGTAAVLLSSALRIFLMCADSNLKLLVSNPSEYRDLMAGRPGFEVDAFRKAQAVLRQVTTAIEVAGSKARRKA